MHQKLALQESQFTEGLVIIFSRLSELESERKLWSDGGLLKSSNFKKGTALFALLLVVGVNLGPLRLGIFKISFATKML